MSHHSNAPVVAHEPPYYAVVFTSLKTAEAGREGEAGGYGETAERMEELVREIPGYLGTDVMTMGRGCSGCEESGRTADPFTRIRACLVSDLERVMMSRAGVYVVMGEGPPETPL